MRRWRRKVSVVEVPTAITLIKKVQIVKGALALGESVVECQMCWQLLMNELSAMGNAPTQHLFASHVLHLVIKRIIISYGKQSASLVFSSFFLFICAPTKELVRSQHFFCIPPQRALHFYMHFNINAEWRNEKRRGADRKDFFHFFVVSKACPKKDATTTATTFAFGHGSVWSAIAKCDCLGLRGCGSFWLVH